MITTGNQCDVDSADCVNHYAQDDGTDVIMGYVEAATDKDRLVAALALARERGKRIVLMKVGSSEAGAQATASHTASLAGSDQVYDGLFKQYGVYRARTIDELFDVAYACSVASQPPKGNRIGLLTVSGGVGALMADVATECGLDVAPMPEDAQRRLKAILPFAGPRNPVDMTAQLVNDLTLFEKNFQLMLEEGGYDVVVAFLSSVGQVAELSSNLLEQLKKVLQRFPDRTVIMSMLASAEVRKLYEAAGVMLFDEPTRAVRAASALVHLAAEAERAKTLSAPPALPAGALAPPAHAINEIEAKRVLASAGIPVVRELLAASEDDAVRCAAETGYPLVLKIASANIAHKSEIGGVLLGLGDEAQVREGFRTLMQRAHGQKRRGDHPRCSPRPGVWPGGDVRPGRRVRRSLQGRGLSTRPFWRGRGARDDQRGQGPHPADRPARPAAGRRRRAGRCHLAALGLCRAPRRRHREHRHQPLCRAAMR